MPPQAATSPSRTAARIVARSYQRAVPCATCMAKIYTRRGDDGSTGLFGGPRVGKDDLRVNAYGDVDELNSALGVARCELQADPRLADLDAFSARLQSELFDLGAELATPDPEGGARAGPRTSR